MTQHLLFKDIDEPRLASRVVLAASADIGLHQRAHGTDDGGGAGEQAAGQIALTGQKADSDANSWQFWASNTNAPVREKSYGGGGSVNQSNNSFAGSLALNLARTNQWVRQNQ